MTRSLLRSAFLFLAALVLGCTSGGGPESIPCEEGMVSCDGACVDTLADPAHCGACGNACAWGERCVDGACGLYCEQEGLTNCGMACADTSSDPAHCGACGNACSGSAQCVSGACVCPSEMLECNGTCVDPWFNPQHCGACNNACGPGQECLGDSCTCAGNMTDCGSGCIDVSNDPNNCGYCGNTCNPGQQCSDGWCSCPEGTMDCGSGCIDVSNDPQNCSYCGYTCNPGEQCSGGVCGCAAGTVDCGFGCADLSSDESNCGVCGKSCKGSEQCMNGSCVCGPGSTQCGGVCTYLQTDANNCGACGVTCAAGKICASGACVAGNNDWGTFGHDERHSGYNPNETGKPPLTLAWSAPVSSGPLNPAVISGGRVFASAAYGAQHLWGLSLTDGSISWDHDFSGAFSVGHPTVYGGNVYVPQCNHSPGTFLWKFNEVTGSLVWKAPFSAQWENYWAPIVVNGNVYFNGGYYGGLYGLHDADGSPLFVSGALEQYDEWSPAYFSGQLFTFVEGSLRAHDPMSGAVDWSVNVGWNWAGWSMNTAPVFDDKRAYVIAPPDLYAIDPSTHAIAWTANGSFQGVPAVANNVVYAIRGGDLQARDASTGALLWMYGDDGSLSYPPVIAGGYVYVSSNGYVHAIDIATHLEVWSAPAGGWLSIGSGKLFVAQSNGSLNAYTLTP